MRLAITGGLMKLSGILSKMLVACVLTFSSFAFSAETLSISASDEVQPASQFIRYNFGRVWINSMNRVNFQIRNVGQIPIEREGFSASGHGYSAYTSCPRVMGPGLQCNLEIRFWPAFEGNHFGRVQMLFTDRNDIIFDLFGEAVRY